MEMLLLWKKVEKWRAICYAGNQIHQGSLPKPLPLKLGRGGFIAIDRMVESKTSSLKTSRKWQMSLQKKRKNQPNHVGKYTMIIHDSNTHDA